MANEELKAAARAGQPKALEALMNQSFGKQGITARVITSGELLKVTLRSKILPDQKTADLVKKGIANIKPQGIGKVSLKGEQIGGRESWTTEWNIAGDSPKVTTVVSRKKTPQWYFHPAVVTVSILTALAFLGSLVEDPEPTPRPTVASSQTEKAPKKKQTGDIPLKPAPIYPSRQPTELEVFQHTMEVKTPGVLASGEIGSLNLSLLEQRCPSLVAASSDAGINTAISMLSSELRLNNGYDEKLATNLATGLIEGCAAWVRGDRISPGKIVDSSKPPTNQSAIDRWEQEYGDK
jgi:hypothetical protein